MTVKSAQRLGHWLSLLLVMVAACTERTAKQARPVSGTEPSALRSNQLPAPSDATPTTAGGGKIRSAQKAGSFYPSERVQSILEMERAFRQARSAPAVHGKPLALVVPHAGWRYSGVAAAAAYATIRGADHRRIVLLGPAHRHALSGFALPKYSAHETPLGQIPLCQEADALRDGELVRDNARADVGEHSIEVQLPWLQDTLQRFCIIPILVGLTNAGSERALAEKLAKLPRDGTLFVVSSDFVHYGQRFDYTPFGDSVSAAKNRIFELEEQAIGLLSRRDPEGLRQLIAKTEATICGYRGILVLLELLRRIAPEAKAVPLAHYSSAELGEERDESGSVGYASIAFTEQSEAASTAPLRAPAPPASCAPSPSLGESLGQGLVQLARATLQTKLQGTEALNRVLSGLRDEARLDCKQAVFVTLRAKGQLRGCVGQVQPTYPLVEAVIQAALDAALEDRRFEPVTAAELDGLSFEVTVLSVPEAVKSYRDIVIGKHGMILSLGGHRALFLPQVPGEQGWDLDKTLSALSNKAGLAEDAWKDPRAQFSVFSGTVFEEPKVQHGGGQSR